MKSIGKVIKDNYYINEKKLIDDFNLAKENNQTFKKIISKLKLPDNYLMKYTTKLEDTGISDTTEPTITTTNIIKTWDK